MDELLNKLIEVDKSARKRVSKAKKEKSLVLEAIEKKKSELKEEGEKKFLEATEEERIRQKKLLEKTSKEIDENCQNVIENLNSIYEEKCGEWVQDIIKKVTQ